MSRSQILVISLALLAIPFDASAETQSLARLPTKGPGRVGFALDVTAEVMGRAGYRPVHVRFNSLTGTFPVDRDVTVRLSPRIYPAVPHEFDFSVTVRLPQGAKSANRTVYVPLYYRWQWCRVRAYEGGRLIENCDTSGAAIATPNQSGAHVAWTNVGVIVPEQLSTEVPWQRVPDVRTLNVALGEGALFQNAGKLRLDNDEASAGLQAPQNSWVQFHPLPEAELTEDWIAYSQLDVVTVAQPVLERLSGRQPRTFAALEKWVAAGGNLWVYGTGSSDAALLAGVSPMDPAKVPRASELKTSLALNQQNSVDVAGYTSYGTTQQDGSEKLREEVYKDLQDAGHPFVRQETAESVAQRILARDVAAGRVVFLQDEDPFPGSFQFWRSVVAATYPPRLTWHIRNGTDVHETNDDYWALLIAAVGRPPVMTFLALITCFVLLIGPIAYHVLSRARRLYLLFLVAPVAAVLVTISLFAYGVLADGLGTRVRPRQITVLDGPTGLSAEVHRQTYFTGSASSSGLVYPADVAVYPIFEDPLRDASYTGFNGSRIAPSSIYHEGTHLRYGGRLFPSRTQNQFLVHHPTSGLGQLRMIGSGDDIRIASTLPFAVTELLVRDWDGDYWSVDEKIDAAGSARARSLDEGSASAWLVLRRRVTALEVPELYRAVTDSDLFGISQRNNYGWGYTQPPRIMEVSQTPRQGVLEQIIAQRFSVEEDPPPGSFIGLAEVTDRLIAAEGAEVTDAIHIILGTLP